MVKNIILHVDEAFFFKMKADKLIRERKSKIMMTWEEYVKMLFGFNRNEKEVRASK